MTMPDDSKFLKQLKQWAPKQDGPFMMENVSNVTDVQLQMLIETYCFIKPSSLSQHQQALLKALYELKEFQTVTNI
jgi:hypothetical protein